MSRVDGTLREQRGPEEEAVWAQQQQCCRRSAHVHARHAGRFARQASHHGSSQSLRVGVDGVATGRQLWRRGSGRARSHEALLWSSRSAVRLSSPDGAPRSSSPRRPFRTLSDQPQWLPVVQSRPRPAGTGRQQRRTCGARGRGWPWHEGATSAAPVCCPG
jgi:hypothetical protein